MGLNAGMLSHLLRGLDPQGVGAYLDTGHLTGEGEETSHGDALRSLSTTVDERSELAGKKVMEVRFPGDVLLTAIYRGKELIIPKGTTKIKAGDRIQVHFPREAKPALTEFLARQTPKE